MKYFHTLEKTDGYQDLNDEACTLLQFGKLSLKKGETYEGSVDADRELMLVMLSGKADVSVSGKTFTVGGRANVLAGNAHSLYLPRGSSFTVAALSNMEAALPTTPSDLDTEPYEIKPDSGGRSTIRATLGRSRYTATDTRSRVSSSAKRSRRAATGAPIHRTSTRSTGAAKSLTKRCTTLETPHPTATV